MKAASFVYPLLLLIIEILHPLVFLNLASAQVIADFRIPDTICEGTSVAVTNMTTGGSTYYWNFCSGDASNNPIGTNLGNPGGLLDVPTYITMVKQDNDCFSFVSCQGRGVIRYYHGNSFKNAPINWSTLGTFGLISYNEEGIQIKNDDGRWIGFVCSDTRLIRLDFGSSLWNTPTPSVVGNIPPQNMLHGLSVVKEGNTWIGFATCSLGNTLLRFNFGTSLLNNPVFTDLGDKTLFDGPGAVCLLFENNNWYAILIAGHNYLARLDFGNSLLNDPAGIDLGNPGGLDYAVGLTILRDCEKTTGYYINYLYYGELGKLNFNGGIEGNVTGEIVGNLGDLSQPHSFSELYRQNDTLFTYITNRGNATLTRLTFLPCNNSSIPSSSLYNPPIYTYNQTGTYNINLVVNEGLPDQANLCKKIVVIDRPSEKLIDTTLCYGDSCYSGGKWHSASGVYYDTIPLSSGCDSIVITTLDFKPEIPVDLGPDTTLCGGNTILLRTGVTDAAYLWQDGSDDSVFLVVSAGHYRVIVTKNYCNARDSIVVSACDSQIWFPNVFTPNADGLNDIFHAVGQKVSIFSMLIFNRWGEQVFETDNFDHGWDGRFREAYCPDGVYFYIATYEMADKPGDTHHAHGSVTLLR